MTSNEEATKRIFREYAKYLDKAGIPYNNRQGFYVYIPLQNIKQSFTYVCRPLYRKILLSDYCGNCCTSLRSAVRVANAIREQCPGYKITVEQCGGSFDLEVYHDFEYTTVEELHREVLGIAHIADVGAAIGKEMLGERFER